MHTGQSHTEVFIIKYYFIKKKKRHQTQNWKLFKLMEQNGRYPPHLKLYQPNEGKFSCSWALGKEQAQQYFIFSDVEMVPATPQTLDWEVLLGMEVLHYLGPH